MQRLSPVYPLWEESGVAPLYDQGARRAGEAVGATLGLAIDATRGASDLIFPALEPATLAIKEIAIEAGRAGGRPTTFVGHSQGWIITRNGVAMGAEALGNEQVNPFSVISAGAPLPEAGWPSGTRVTVLDRSGDFVRAIGTVPPLTPPGSFFQRVPDFSLSEHYFDRSYREGVVREVGRE